VSKRPMALERVQKLVRGHDKRMRRDREEMDWHRAAHDGEFWAKDNKWNKALPDLKDKLPVKVEVNLVKPWLQRLKAALFYRNPRCEAILPAVIGPRSRQKVDTKKQQGVAAALDEWLGKKDSTQAVVLHAFDMGWMYKGCALKLAFDADRPKGSPLDRIRMRAIPRWEAMWDERATVLADMRYLGHIRYVPIEDALELLEGLAEDTATRSLPDFVAEQRSAMSQDDEDGRDTAYVRILEFYDFVGGQQRWFLVGEGDDGCLTEFPSQDIPYTWADGSPAAPIFPVVLEHTPEFPFKAVSPCKAIYENGAERSLLLTVVANAFRRDSARIIFWLKGHGLDDTTIKKIQNAFDTENIELDIDAGMLDKIYKVFDAPDLAKSIDKYAVMLDLARQDQTTQSDLAQGRQGKYLSATESQILAAGDEQAATEPQARMSACLSRAAELVLRMIAEEAKGGGMQVRVGTEVVRLQRADLGEAWNINIVDSSSTPMKQAQKQGQFVAIHEKLLALATLASEPPPPAPGAPAPPPVPPAVRALAAAMLDYAGDLWDLPENMRWSVLSQEETDEPPAELATRAAAAEMAPPAGAPMAPGAAPEMDPARMQAMYDALPPEQQAMIAQAVQQQQGGAPPQI
jgi:hypothetical protein